MWLSPHKESGDDGRRIAENHRVFPEGDPVFTELYGAGRNTSEGDNAHHKDTYPTSGPKVLVEQPFSLTCICTSSSRTPSRGTSKWGVEIG